MRLIVFRIALMGGWLCSAFGQSPAVIAPRASKAIAVSPANLRLDVKLILVPVSVTDARDRPVTTLAHHQFRLLEEGVEQKISTFSLEEGPVSLGILFDSSGSMKDRLDASITALREFFLTLTPGDEFFLVQFSDNARVLAGFTPEPNEIFTPLGGVRAYGWTALLDAVALGAHQMRLASNSRHALLILSDGEDNNSRFSESEIQSIVGEADLRIYSVCLFHKTRFLQQLAQDTGGQALIAQNLNELPAIVQKLSAELRSQYLLGYSPENLPNDGKYHKVKVELIQPPGDSLMRLSWKHGYYAPSE